MERTPYVGTKLLNAISAQLESIPPERFRPPKRDAPPFAMRIGTASEYQRALVTMIDIADHEHRAIHQVTGLKFGINANLNLRHRTLHMLIDIGEVLLAEDITQNFSPFGKRNFFIDRNWDVHAVRSDSFSRLFARLIQFIKSSH